MASTGSYNAVQGLGGAMGTVCENRLAAGCGENDRSSRAGDAVWV